METSADRVTRYNPGQKRWDTQPFPPLNSKDNAPLHSPTPIQC